MKLFCRLFKCTQFERDVLRSGIAAAQARGMRFGRQTGQRVKADRYQKRTLELVP